MKAFQSPWQVLLLGGASGVGKTSVSYRLAQHYAAGLTEVDDFVVVLEHMTDPSRYPLFHFWRTHTEEAQRMDDDEQLAFFQRYASALEDALALVIGNHIETRMPIVLEGDFILPSLGVRRRYGDQEANGQIRAIFLYEQDERQMTHNFRQRYGHDQSQRAHISWCVSEWLRADACRLGLPTIPARPWNTVLDRAIAAIDRAELEDHS